MTESEIDKSDRTTNWVAEASASYEPPERLCTEHETNLSVHMNTELSTHRLNPCTEKRNMRQSSSQKYKNSVRPSSIGDPPSSTVAQIRTCVGRMVKSVNRLIQNLTQQSSEYSSNSVHS